MFWVQDRSGFLANPDLTQQTNPAHELIGFQAKPLSFHLF
ncbi:hypothetical protein SLEP1_g24456 [Rubroshorea leprosula]|uniref:Uncharacterized protein n=1 Tax=Rubroshorea leprosula TaxID=152421 RepID=A0AAV5JQ20_9ROSI|nr:hypothetical protein SLEP1_g24456 [Rubroshorea leprosula]